MREALLELKNISTRVNLGTKEEKTILQDINLKIMP